MFHSREDRETAAGKRSERNLTEDWWERRKFDRYEIDTELTASLLLPDNHGSSRGQSLDISIAGIAGVFITGWEIGTRVSLEFSVPLSQQKLQVQAIVRNRSGHRYGFEFLDLSGTQREIIQQTCRVLALLE